MQIIAPSQKEVFLANNLSVGTSRKPKRVVNKKDNLLPKDIIAALTPKYGQSAQPTWPMILTIEGIIADRQIFLLVEQSPPVVIVALLDKMKTNGKSNIAAVEYRTALTHHGSR